MHNASGFISPMNTPARILIVDDSETNRDVIVTRLRAHGYETAEAEDGEQGLAAVSASPPDLILLDVTMPKLDGLQMCRELRGKPMLEKRGAGSL